MLPRISQKSGGLWKLMVGVNSGTSKDMFEFEKVRITLGEKGA